MQAVSCGTWTLRQIVASFRCLVRMWMGSPSRMSRDFSPDLESFRAASRQPRQKRHETPPGEPDRGPRRLAERTQLRPPEVNGIRAREVPAKESRVILYDRYRGYPTENCDRNHPAISEARAVDSRRQDQRAHG